MNSENLLQQNMQKDMPNHSIENVINKKAATELINNTNTPIPRTVKPVHILNKLNQQIFIDRVIIEFIQCHVILFMIIFYILHLIFQTFFYNKKFNDISHIFLISIIPSVFAYLNGQTKWNDYIIGNAISAITSYFVNMYLNLYLHYILREFVIILISIVLMLLCNSFSIPALIYGLIGYSLVSKLGTDYVYKYLIYVVLSFFIMSAVIYINNIILTHMQQVLSPKQATSLLTNNPSMV